MGETPLAVIVRTSRDRKRISSDSPLHEDENLFAQAYRICWTGDPRSRAVPDEPIPNTDGCSERLSAVTRYGLRTWGDLFNRRQLLALADYSVAKFAPPMTPCLTQGIAS